MNLFDKLGAEIARTGGAEAWRANQDARAAAGEILSAAQHRVLIAAGVGRPESAGVLAEHEAAEQRHRASAVKVIAAVATLPFVAGALPAFGGLTKLALGAVPKLVAGKSQTTAPVAAQRRPDVFGSDGMIDFSQVGDLALQIANQYLSQQAAPVQTAAPVAAAAGLALPALGGIARALSGAAGAAVGILRSAGGRILGWILPSGQKVTRKAAVALAKSMGLQAAATAMGIGAIELAEAVMQEEGRSRRRRGISARDLTVTTRTMGRVERMHRRIAKAARSHAR